MKRSKHDTEEQTKPAEEPPGYTGPESLPPPEVQAVPPAAAPLPPAARRAMQLIQDAWLRNQQNAGGGVTLDREQAAALYAHVCKLEGREPA